MSEDYRWRKISTALLRDLWFKSLSKEGKLLYVSLILSPETLPSGVNLNPRLAILEAGLETEKGFEILEKELSDKVIYFQKYSLVLIKNYSFWQLSNPNQWKAALKSIVRFPIEVQSSWIKSVLEKDPSLRKIFQENADLFPEPLRQGFFAESKPSEKLKKGLESLSEKILETVTETLRETLPETLPETVQERVCETLKERVTETVRSYIRILDIRILDIRNSSPLSSPSSKGSLEPLLDPDSGDEKTKKKRTVRKGLLSLRKEFGDDKVDWALAKLEEELKEGRAKKPKRLSAYLRAMIENTPESEFEKWRRKKALDQVRLLKEEYFKLLGSPRFQEFQNLSELELRRYLEEAKLKFTELGLKRPNAHREALEVFAFKIWLEEVQGENKEERL